MNIHVHSQTEHSLAAETNPAPLDIRVRLLITVVTSAAVLILNQPIALGALCVIGAAYMSAMRRWRIQLNCYIILSVMAGLSILFFYGFRQLLPIMRETTPAQLLVPFLRMLTLLHVVLPLALSIRLRDMLAMMKRFRFSRALYLPLAVTIRFIPGLIYDLRQMRDCLRLRGYHNRSLWRPRLWLLPIIFRCLHLSDEMAIAAELKGVGYGRPAHIRPETFLKRRNVLAITVLICSLIFAFGVNLAFPPTGPTSPHSKMHRHAELPRSHETTDKE